jgi:hypothetical protein
MSNEEWNYEYSRLLTALNSLGYKEEFGYAIAKNLGSPKTMRRMSEYLLNVKPKSEELVIDEMLAIMEDRKRWIDKKESEEANAAYNEWLNRR